MSAYLAITFQTNACIMFRSDYNLWHKTWQVSKFVYLSYLQTKQKQIPVNKANMMTTCNIFCSAKCVA